MFHGEASDGTCSGCHGSDAGGSPQGPPLNGRNWLWSDGSLAGLSAIIEKGVAHPTRYQAVMPPLGGAPLSKRTLPQCRPTCGRQSCEQQLMGWC
ncbi:MAG: c-type cytochrome [Candidatus Binataceae bacterium]